MGKIQEKQNISYYEQFISKYEGCTGNRALSKLNLLDERSCQVLSLTCICNIKRLAPMRGPSKTYFLVLFTTIPGILFALFCGLLNISFGSTCFFLLIFLLYCQILPCPFKSKIVWNYLSHNKSAVWIKSLWRAARFPRHMHNRNSISLHLSTGRTTNSCISQRPTNCAMKRVITTACQACAWENVFQVSSVNHLWVLVTGEGAFRNSE